MKLTFRKLKPTRVSVALLAFISLSLNSVSFAQSLLIKGAKIHTLSSQATLDKGDILIVDGLIKQVAKDISAKADRVVDGSDKVITPGIFAVANQLGVLEINALQETSDASTSDELLTASFSIEQAFNPNSTLIPHNRNNGVTRTLISPFSSHSLLSGQGAIMSMKGDYDSLIRKDIAIFGSYGEYGSQLAGGSRAAALAILQTAIDEAKEYRQHQEAIDLGEYRELENSLDDLQALQAIIEREIPLVLSVNRASDMKALMAFAKKNNIRMVFTGAAEAWMVAKDIAKSEIPVMIDPIDNIPGSFESLGKRLENAALLNEAGVQLIFLGQSFQATHNAHMVRQSAGNAVAYGLPYQVALQAMTVNPARVFGGSSNYGKLVPGYKAELVIWDGDPLELTTHAEQVMIDGAFTNMTSRADRLRDRYKDISDDKNTAYRK